MAKITTSKEINLDQLNKELGNQGLIADFNDSKKKVIGTVETSTITQEELENAIKAHVAGPTQVEVTKLNRQQGIIKLKELGFTDDEIDALING
jgi:hypothetical protein